MVIHESAECEAETLGELLRGAGDEVCEIIRFEAQPQAFDGVEIRAVGREEPALEVVPVEAGGFVPARVIKDEDAPFPGSGWDGFGEVVEVALEDVGIHAVKDHAKAASALGADGSDHVGADVVGPCRGFAGGSHGTPAAARTRVAFDSALVAIPNLHGWVLL